MELTKERKILFALLGVGAMALLCDRVLFQVGGAAEASASAMTLNTSPVEDAGQSLTVPAMVMGQASASSEVSSIVSDLERLSQARSGPDRDAFGVDKTWVASHAAEPTDVSPVALTQQAFTQKHVLTAIIDNSAGGVAVVNGVPRVPGQRVDGFVLVAVKTAQTRGQSAEAIFESPDGQRVKLVMKADQQ